MATVKFSTRSNSNPSNIYVRFTANRETIYRVVTPLNINPEYLNNKTGKVRKVATYKDKDIMQTQLNEFSTYLINQYNKDLKTGKVSGSGWLKDCVKQFFNLNEKNDLNYLSEYATHYIDKLKIKRNDETGQIGVTKSTIQKYSTIRKKIIAFDKYKRKRFKLNEVNTKYRNEFLTYLLEIDKLGRNTSGRYLRFLKTICKDAQKSGFKVSPELEQIKGFSVKADKIYLSFDELKQIEQTVLKDEVLNYAKDWLILGCYIGQRVGDLLSLTSKNLTRNGNLEFIELEQQKTGKRVAVVVLPKVAQILAKYGGNFPPIPYKNIESSKTVFNRQIKDVARMSGLNEKVQGSKMNPKTNRKESGTFFKWELVTSHICRRSFATNHYGVMPTALIMNVTGHSTEREFLNYIGKTNIDYAEQMAQYYNMQSQKESIKKGEISTPLKVVSNEKK